MRILVSLLLIAFVTALALGSVFYVDAGYVLLSWDTYTYESSVWVFLLVLALISVVLYFVFRSLLILLGSDWRFNEWRKRKRGLRANTQTTRGLLALAEGQWRRAERNLTANAKDAGHPLINYLAAARAAYEQGKDDTADEWLKAASKSTAGSDLAVGITQVQLLQSRNQYEQALAVLVNLREKHPRHAYLLKLLVKTLQELEDWVSLNELLPVLRKATKIPEDKIKELEEKVAIQLMKKARHSPAQNIGRVFDALNSSTKHSLPVLSFYVEMLVEMGKEDQAITVLRDNLKQVWHDDLVCTYGKLKGNDDAGQLLFAEKQLPERPNDAILLLTLGRLSLRMNNLEKAKEYLETGLRIKRLPELHAEMAKVKLLEGDETIACEHFQLALDTCASS